MVTSTNYQCKNKTGVQVWRVAGVDASMSLQ